MSSGGGWLAFCSHGCSRLCSRGDPFMGENAHGMPFEGIPLSPSHAGGERKRKSCGATSGEKVPTRGFSAKKEGVWRDLPAIFHSRNFGKKGSRVARPLCHFSLADFRRKRKRCGATSRNSLFLCLPVQIKCSLNAPMGDVKRK